MRYKVNDEIKYIGKRGILKQGKILKVKGILRNKYLVATKVIDEDSYKLCSVPGVVEIKHSDIIEKVGKANG